MSWMPDNDPVLGDPQSCDALDLVIVPRTRDLGGTATTTEFAAALMDALADAR